MQGTRISLCCWLFLLLSQLPFCTTDAGKDLSTVQSSLTQTQDHDGNATPPSEASLSTIDRTNSPDAGTNDTCGNCLIDTETGLIAMGSAGGLIVCLLIATVVLACQVYKIQHRVYAPRSSRSNTDLVSGAGCWGTDRPEVGGLVGPCDTSVMLEEVRADSQLEDESQAKIRSAQEETGGGLVEGATAMDFDHEEKACYIPSSSSRDSCLEIPRDLEDMPLVV